MSFKVFSYFKSGVCKSFYSISTLYLRKMSTKPPSSTTQIGQISTTKNITIKAIGINNGELSLLSIFYAGIV